MRQRLGLLVAAATMLMTAMVGPSPAQNTPLTAYCPMSDEDCTAVLKAFTAESGIPARFVRIGAGEILARIRAERNNPQAGLWLAGAADNFIQGAAEGLLSPHRSANIGKVDKRFVDAQNAWTPISISPIVFASSAKVLKELGAQPPTSWKAFTEQSFKQSVALAHPASSGTAYVALATMVQLFGEDQAFEMMKQIDRNVVQYTRSGIAPSRMVASNEIAVAMAFTQDIEAALEQGYPVGFSFPAEGTGFEVNAAAVVANAPPAQRKAAEAFIDWILSDKGQAAMSATFRGAIVPGHPNPKAKIAIDGVKLIDYNFEWAGQNRARLLQRFEQQVRHVSSAK